MDLSAGRIARARLELSNELSTDAPPIDVVAFGSMARYEMTTQSDFDYLVVAYGLDVQPGSYRRGLAIADRLRTTLDGAAGSVASQAIRQPGASGLFGTIVSAPDLIEVIGLERDTNHSHSRRVLLLEESVSLYRPSEHASLLEAIIGRYLEARPPRTGGMPRFLLNDLARYWRTLSVDYQAKTSPPVRYSLRYLKLLISRKLTYASALAPLVVAVLSEPADLNFALRHAYAQPPALRLLGLADLLAERGDAPAVAAVASSLDVANEFTALLGDSEWRAQIDRDCSSQDPRNQRTFAHGRDLARDLQEHLEALFFSRTISPIAKKYLTF